MMSAYERFQSPRVLQNRTPQMLRIASLLLFIASGLPGDVAMAVNPMPPYGTFPCTPSTQNCGGGGTYSNTTDLQTKVSDRSGRSSCASVDTFGNCFGNFQGSTCPGSSQWVLSPKVLGVGHTVLNAGTGQVQFSVEYDFPNNYCQTWDPASTWPIPPPSHQTRLQIFSGANELVASVGVFEHGIWKPTLTVGCGAQDLTVVATTFGASPSQASMTYSLAAGCRQPDRGSCPAGSGGAGTGVGQPINVGSGDVSTSIPLFTLQQSPLPLVFNLSYHSSALTYTNVTVPEPLGKGWTHPFNQVLKPIPSTNPQRLYHYTADGREFEYTQNGSSWTASRPAEARGTVTLVSGEYRLTDLDGAVTAFDQATGSWKRTTDRWGNFIQATPVGPNPTTLTDSIGRQITLTYSGGLLQSISVPETPTPRVWNFTVTSGLLMSVRDPLHPSVNWRSLGYSANQLAAITDDAPKTLEGHTYDAQGRGYESYSEGLTRNYVKVEYDLPLPGQRRVTTRIDGTTNQVSVFTVSYQGGRWLPTQIDGPCSTCSGASGDTQTFTYTGDNHVDTFTDAKGNVTKFIYNADGNVSSKTEAQNDASVTRTTTWNYAYPAWPNFWTSMVQPSAAKPGQSKTTTRSLTGSGETTLTVTEAGYLLSTDSVTTSYITTTSFDAHHRITQINGPRAVADTTTYVYFPDTPVSNNVGRLNTVTNAVSLTTTYTGYDIFGTPLTTTDANGVQTVLAPDARGRILTSTLKGDASEPTDFVTAYLYDGRDRLTQMTLPLQNAVAYGYEDGSNRLLDTIRLDASTPKRQMERLHLTLNDYGGKVQEEAQKCGTPAATCTTWAQQRTGSFTYDTKNRLLKTTHPIPASSFIQYTYDADGLLYQVQDERHSAANTIYGYDALNRLKTVTQKQVLTPGPDVVTTYGYDAQDNLTSVTDPNGNVTTYAYDDFKRLQKQISPVSGTTTHSYDEAGNLVTSTDANGAATTRSYDFANRLLSASSVRSGNTELVTYTYDDATAGKHGKGRVATMTDPTGSTSFAYDRRGLVKTESRIINGTAFTQSYGYDANGNRTSITYPSTRVVSYTYDYADRPYSATSGGTNYVTAATYYAFGPENTLSLGNSTTRTATFDLRYRPATLMLTGASSSVSYAYSPDSLGNIGGITDNVTSAYSRTFGYDDLNRLTSATTGAGGTPPLWGSTGSFTYDSLGNRKTMNLGTRSVTYTYEAVSGHDTSRLYTVSEGSLAVRHDNTGNEYQFGSSAATFSPRNYQASADTTSFQYDGRGVRVVEQTPSGGSLFYTITPCRVFDTRAATGPYGAPAIGAFAMRAFTIWGVCGIPASGPRAIALNLTGVNPPSTGSLTLFPSDVGLPNSSSISVKPGYTRANNGVIRLSSTGSISLYNSLSSPIDMLMDVSGYFADAPASNRYFFYSPELSLVSETGIAPYGQAPAPLYEYIWFGGRPVAQETVGASATKWTVTDHLGTPFLQMDASRAITWRVEYEPFGKIYAFIAGSSTDPQPLRLPGQEARTSHAGRSYNVFRWYRPDAGRFVQRDLVFPPVNIYSYANDNPITWKDPLGLAAEGCCNPKAEEGNIRKRAERVRDVMRSLEQTGHLPITDRTAGAAMTFCNQRRMILPNGSLGPAVTEYRSGETLTGAEETPCVRICFDAHEATHRRQCSNFGPLFMLLSDMERDFPAYNNELGCLLQTLAGAGLRRPE